MIYQNYGLNIYSNDLSLWIISTSQYNFIDANKKEKKITITLNLFSSPHTIKKIKDNRKRDNSIYKINLILLFKYLY